MPHIRTPFSLVNISLRAHVELVRQPLNPLEKGFWRAHARHKYYTVEGSDRIKSEIYAMRSIKPSLDLKILMIGLVFSLILFIITPRPHSVFLKDDQFYRADTRELVQIKGILHFQGGMSIDTISGGGWSGDYPLYQYVPSPNWIYSLAGTTIIASIIRIHKEYKNTMQW